MLLQHGCTSVIDIESVPELLPEVYQSAPLNVLSCLEMTGVRGGRRPEEILHEAESHAGRIEASGRPAGFSPHALYSTPDGLIERTVQKAKQTGRLVTMHVAESASEFELYTNGRGAMFDWLSPQRSLSDAGKGTPVQQLARRGVLHRGFLAVHANYLVPDDIELLAENEVTVVHCPRSHNYFRHAAFPLDDLMKAGVNVCLGTDSLATVRTGRRSDVELDLFAEMRALQKSNPGLAPEALLRMATVQASQIGFGLERRGRMEPDCLADLIAVSCSGSEKQALEAVIQHREPVVFSMIEGRQAIGQEWES